MNGFFFSKSNKVKSKRFHSFFKKTIPISNSFNLDYFSLQNRTVNAYFLDHGFKAGLKPDFCIKI